MEHAIDGMSATERLILLMRWGDACTVDEMARVLQIDRAVVLDTISRVRRIAADALALSSSSCPARSPDPLR